MDSQDTAGPRKVRRRTDEERIQELEARIAELRARQEAQKLKEDPVLKEIPKLQKRLRKFAQLATDHERPDVANSAMAFHAGLERLRTAESKRRSAKQDPELEDELA